MNQKLKVRFVLTALAGLALAAPGTLHAQVLLKVTMSATMYQQNTNTSDNGTTTTTKPPAKSSLTTASLLKDLALFEQSEGNWTNPTFPASAALVFNGSGFQINEGTNELVDVSDALSYSQSGQNDISTGSYLDANGQGSAPYNQTDYYLVTVTYTGSAFSFTVTGLATVTGKATNPNTKTGNYTQSDSFSLQDGTGEGAFTSSGVPFVLTGFTVTGSGSATENNGLGTDE
jgi:hypothetical protein